MSQRLAVLSGHLAPTQCMGAGAAASGALAATPKALLERERAKATVSARELELWLEDGAEAVALKHECFGVIATDPEFAVSLAQFDNSTEERRIESTRRLLRFSDLIQGRSEEYELALIRAVSLADSSTTIRWFVQKLLWIDTIRNQGTPEQIERWTAGALEYKIVGCFAMTELGHSSALRGLETTATYDTKTEQFVIHSPTTTSTKFWIGTAGQIATHAIVFANAFSLGRALGVQLFIVPIRDIATASPLAGVEVGDLGPKYGLDGNDNGYIRFSHVRVPRDHMLGRWSQVAADGTFKAPPLAALAYGSTIAERLTSYYYTDRAVLTACVRFCLIRTQGASSPEPQIMDYATHFARLMPYLASQYMRAGFARAQMQRYRGFVQKLRAGDEKSYLAALPEMHAVACALKSFGSWDTMDMFELCRRLMGGHAFHTYSGVGRALADSAVSTTGGGDNNVLVQQTASFLLKHYRRARSGDRIEPGSSVSFFADHQRLLSLKRSTLTSWSDAVANADALLDMFRARCLQAVDHLASALSSTTLPLAEAWNNSLLDLMRAVEAFYWLNVLDSAADATRTAGVSPALADALRTMWTLTALWRVERTFSDFALSLFEPRDVHWVRAAITHGSQLVRANAAVLVDAFGIPDKLLRVPLANSDGSAYDAYLDAVRASRLNETRVWPHWQQFFAARQTKH